MNILLGYGTIINDIKLFDPKKLFNLFELEENPDYKELIPQLSDEELFDILVYAEEIGIATVLMKIADKSDIVEYVYTGEHHALLFKTQMPWNVTVEMRNLSESDILDEIKYIVEPYLVHPFSFECHYIYAN